MNKNSLPDSVRITEIDRLFLLAIRYASYRAKFHKRVARTNPRYARSLFVAVVSSVRFTHRFLQWVAPNKYTDADPYKILMVDPTNVEYTTGDIYSKRRGWVVDGTWDRKGRRYMNRPNPKAIRQRFVDGSEWKETVLAEKYETSKFERRTESIDRLYGAIRENGYKSQQQLLKDDPKTAWSGLNDAMHPLANEVAVDIGRDGELLWNICGQHRLAIAKILDIEHIPVQVFRRHAEWQNIRDRARRGEEIPEKFHDHPDLADVLETG